MRDRHLTINIPTMAHRVHHHLARLIVDGIKHPIIADSQSIGFLSLKFLDTSWTGVAFKLQKTLIDTFLSLGRKSRQLPFGRTLDQDPISHGILWTATTRIFQVLTERAGRLALSTCDGRQVLQI